MALEPAQIVGDELVGRRDGGNGLVPGRGHERYPGAHIVEDGLDVAVQAVLRVVKRFRVADVLIRIGGNIEDGFRACGAPRVFGEALDGEDLLERESFLFRGKDGCNLFERDAPYLFAHREFPLASCNRARPCEQWA